MLLADGSVVHASRNERSELFRLVLGGYGLFGVILEATLKLAENRPYNQHATVLPSSELPAFFKEKVLTHPRPTLFIARPSIAKSSFLDETLVRYWQEIDAPSVTIPLGEEQHVARDRFVFDLSRATKWGKELRWVLEKHFAFKEQLVSRNNAMRPPVVPLKFIEYVSSFNTDTVQEYFIPTEKLVPFMKKLRTMIPIYNVNLLAVTIRYVKQTQDVFLSYAPLHDCFSVMLYVNQERSPDGIQRIQKITQEIIDLALSYGGTFYLTYQNHATADQLRSAYPMIDEFFAKKLEYDPWERFQNTFYCHYRELLGSDRRVGTKVKSAQEVARGSLSQGLEKAAFVAA